MKTISLGYGLSIVMILGCGGRQSTPSQATTPSATATPVQPTTKQVKVTGIQRMNFPSGDSALVLNYETEIRIEDKKALEEEVAGIWQRFQKDVEKAQVNAGVIRATHYDSTGFIRRGKGYGFAFTKDKDGSWRRSDDEAKKP